MTGTEAKTLPLHPFWEFASMVSQSPVVKNACMDLQNRHQLNANLLLFCCWVAHSGRGHLDMYDMNKGIRIISQWNRDITQTLRTLRTKLTSSRHQWAGRIEKTIQEQELHSEQIEQLLLAENIVKSEIRHRSALEKITDAIVSLGVYFHRENIQLSPEDDSAVFRLISGIFSDLPKVDVAKLYTPMMISKTSDK